MERGFFFGAAELGCLGVALGRAREMTGGHFALPNAWFESTSHEVCSLRNLRRSEVRGDGCLAEIRRLQRVLGDPARILPSCDSVCPHYRICLQDHNILRCLDRHKDAGVLDLLTWVLIHELVHLVRFQRLEFPYHASPAAVEAEEWRVRATVEEIIRRQAPPAMRRAVEKLQSVVG